MAFFVGGLPASSDPCAAARGPVGVFPCSVDVGELLSVGHPVDRGRCTSGLQGLRGRGEVLGGDDDRVGGVPSVGSTLVGGLHRQCRLRQCVQDDRHNDPGSSGSGGYPRGML